jgi:DNA-binding response OmpR family regulator
MAQILIIDDTNDHRDNISEILTLNNYTVSTASNGRIGVELALQEKPDLILCDVRMPELDGFDVLDLIRNNHRTANIPFVFLTAMAEKNDMDKGLDMGANDFIIKPFDVIHLLRTVEEQLKKGSRKVKSTSLTGIPGPVEWLQNLAVSLDQRYSRQYTLPQKKQDSYETSSVSNRIFLF